MKMWKQFDNNEIYLLILLTFVFVVLFLVLRKKIFKPHITLLSLVWGFTVGILIEFTIGGGLLDFYRVNDSNSYEVTDVVYFLLFSPFGYFFFYFYHRFKINKKKVIFYVFAWAIVGVGAHWLFTQLGIINLQKGFRIAYSFPIFLVIQTLTAILYEQIKYRENIFQSPMGD
ncbi:hypothetical protein [Robertmurraya korlensis]|uniref:hypothetical protein n=1 Tax=Robertmurraya korlensis TaxID=519977 RepID=UPI0008241688|nr:hypothetical protein [Robertmurraya korlensis]